MYIKIININTSNWATDRDIKYCRAEILCNYYYYSVKYTRTMFMYFSQTDFKTPQFLLGWLCKKHGKFCLINYSCNHYIITRHFIKAVTCGNPGQTNNEDPGGRWEERARFQCPQLKEFQKRRARREKWVPLNEHVMNQTEARQSVQPNVSRSTVTSITTQKRRGRNDSGQFVTVIAGRCVKSNYCVKMYSKNLHLFSFKVTFLPP